MKLDNDLLKNMIAETLGAVIQELTEEETTPEIDAARKTAAAEQEQAADAQEQAVKAKVNVAELEAKKAEQDAAEAEQEAGGTMGESFQLTKGRLRQIIAEELASAKKQGIL